MQPLGIQSITDLSSVQSLTLPSGRVDYAWITVADNNVRFRVDGVAPTDSVGHLIPGDSAPVMISMAEGLSNAQFIEEASATLFVTYFGDP